jgi:hypothetical protein
MVIMYRHEVHTENAKRRILGVGVFVSVAVVGVTTASTMFSPLRLSVGTSSRSSEANRSKALGRTNADERELVPTVDQPMAYLPWISSPSGLSGVTGISS